MSETVSASGSQALEQQTDEDSLCGVYEKFYQGGKDDPGDATNSLAISKHTSSLPYSYAMTSGKACAWKPCSVGFGKSVLSATFNSTDDNCVAHVSLCYLFQPPKKCLVIAIYSHSRPDHESHGHGEPAPTGVWIGMSNGGLAYPPADR